MALELVRVASGEAVVTDAVPGADAAELADRVPAQAVLDGKPLGGPQVFVVAVAVLPIHGRRDGELIGEAGTVFVLAEVSGGNRKSRADVLRGTRTSVRLPCA